MVDVRRKLGTPTPRHPISGEIGLPPRTRLRHLGQENGWTYQYDRGNPRFIKGDLVLDVYFYGNHIAHGVLFNGLGRGMNVRSNGINDVLAGETCICPSLTDEEWEQGLDARYLPECPIDHGGIK